MATVYAPMPPARIDRTADDAIARVEREEPAISRRLMVSIGDRCGDRLIEAFARVARAYYAGSR
jgi:hypothetical protein